MSYDTNPYYNPNALGLTTVAEIDYSSGSYEFDMRVVWRHRDGAFYTQRDSGCSCPTPFEDYCSLELLDRLDLSVLRAEGAKELREPCRYVAPQEVREFLAAVEALLDGGAEPFVPPHDHDNQDDQ